MDNFEARYRAIVEKEPKLKNRLHCDERGIWFDTKDGESVEFDRDTARDCACWWLEINIPEKARITHTEEYAILEILDSHGWRTYHLGERMEAVLLGHEIILGIKEKA